MSGASGGLLGLQLERTALAWRRTALAILLAGAVGTRLLADRAPAWAAGALALGVAGAAVACWIAARRLHHVAIALDHGDAMAPLPGGGTLAWVAAGQVLAGLVALALIID